MPIYPDKFIDMVEYKILGNPTCVLRSTSFIEHLRYFNWSDKITLLIKDILFHVFRWLSIRISRAKVKFFWQQTSTMEFISILYSFYKFNICNRKYLNHYEPLSVILVRYQTKIINYNHELIILPSFEKKLFILKKSQNLS
jgi:hypothetical protein